MRCVVGMHCYERHFPVAPVSRSFLVFGWIEVHEEAMIGFSEAASTLLFGDTTTKTGARLREKNANFPGYPIDLPYCGCGDGKKHHFGLTMGMSLSVNDRQSRSPGPSKYQAPLDIEVPTQQFDIGEEMSCRVRGQIDVGLAGSRRSSSRSALVERNDPIDL
jgi:hypothetical protein